jgi:hypothetical protein
MGKHQSTPQEARTERASLAVTKAEKQAIKAVAAARETDESNLLRCTLLADILTEYERIRAVVREEVA